MLLLVLLLVLSVGAEADDYDDDQGENNCAECDKNCNRDVKTGGPCTCTGKHCQVRCCALGPDVLP